jgi:SAM-dependent methyltransferase
VGIQPHNDKAAATWDSGGADYELVSVHLADSIDRAVAALGLKPGDRALDVGTGTGLAARRAAALGATAIGIDLGPELIATARRLAPAIDFRIGDAERLEFADASFDAAISTFGIMFVNRPEAAAGELARVVRPGGRIALASWLPDGSVARKFGVHRPYLPPSSGPSPFDWGKPERVRELLGGAFELTFETAVTTLRLGSSQEAWEMFSRGYGPTRMLAGSPDFKRDFLAYYDGFKTSTGVAVPREYLLVAGTRR